MLRKSRSPYPRPMSPLSRSKVTFYRAMNRNPTPRDVDQMRLPGQILGPDERVYEVAVGDPQGDTNPLLLVTDRRVLLARESLIRGWRVREEFAGPEVAGAEYRGTLLSGRLTVHARDGRTLRLRTAYREPAEKVVALVRHLPAGGHGPT